MIDSYAFGQMVINGKQYTSDVILYPDGRIQRSWWRREGHTLSSKDIVDLIQSKPEVIVAGTGSSGLMRPAAKLEELLADKGIAFIAKPSKKAAETFNSLTKQGKKVGGCFHLTC